jgi:hypothetical protein
VTDGDNAADEENAHSGERKYAGGICFAQCCGCSEKPVTVE